MAGRISILALVLLAPLSLAAPVQDGSAVAVLDRRCDNGSCGGKDGGYGGKDGGYGGKDDGGCGDKCGKGLLGLAAGVAKAKVDVAYGVGKLGVKGAEKVGEGAYKAGKYGVKGAYKAGEYGVKGAYKVGEYGVKGAYKAAKYGVKGVAKVGGAVLGVGKCKSGKCDSKDDYKGDEEDKHESYGYGETGVYSGGKHRRQAEEVAADPIEEEDPTVEFEFEDEEEEETEEDSE